MSDPTARLLVTIQAAVPAVTDVSVGVIGQPATVSVRPANQQAAAQATIDAFDWSAGAQAAWENLQARTLAVVLLADPAGAYKLIRAVADAARDSDNVLRAWLAAFKVEVAAATNLADLKTRVAALPAMPAISNATLRIAITNRVNDGTVDT